MNPFRSTLLVSSVLLAAYAMPAQQSGSTNAAARVEVSAPFAQQLIVKEKAIHPEIQKLGLHAVPPGQTQNVIVANNLPEKIGKVSSSGDMQLVASGEPQVVKKEGFWDTFVPLHDQAGKIIGFLVMEVPFATAASREDAVAKGAAIRDEVQKQTPTLATLFGPPAGGF